MSNLVYTFEEFVNESSRKLDVHGYNKAVRDPNRAELAAAGIDVSLKTPLHHDYVRFIKSEIDSAKRLMDEMNYDTAIMALEEAEYMLKQLKEAVIKADLYRQEEEPVQDEDDESVTEEEKTSMRTYHELLKGGVLPKPDMEDFKNLPEHYKWFRWLKDDANFLVDRLQDGNFRMVNHYVKEMEWLLSKVKDLAEEAASEEAKNEG